MSLRVAFVRGSDTSWNRELFFTSLLNQLADATIPEPHAPVSHSSATAKLTKSYATLSSAKMRRTCQSTDVFIESLKALLFRSASTVRACIMVDDVQNFSADLFGETFVSVLLRLDELVRKQHNSAISVLYSTVSFY